MRSKSELYQKEQKDICERIIEILNLDERRSITLYELDHDITKQGQIMNLLPEIRKYFSPSYIEGARHPQKIKRPYLSIIKSIVKGHYQLISSVYRYDIGNNQKVQTMKYYFIRMESID